MKANGGDNITQADGGIQLKPNNWVVERFKLEETSIDFPLTDLDSGDAESMIFLA